MAVTAMSGFELNDTSAANNSPDTTTLVGTASISTTQVYTGARALRCNPASGASGYANNPSNQVVRGYWHFRLYVATMPSVTRVIAGDVGVNNNNLVLNSDGTLSYRINTTVVGTSAKALTAGVWYWIGYRTTVSVTGVLVQIDAVDQVSGSNGSTTSLKFGCSGTEASAIDIYFDDFIEDSAGYLNPSRVGLAVPISDVSRTDWTNDAAGTTLFSALNSKPPTGIADTTSGSGTHQVRDATNGTDTFVVNMTTYATLGIVSTDTVLAVLPFASTGAPSATSPKTGSLTVSNPTIAKTSFANFYNDTIAAGTYPVGWIYRIGTMTALPTITIANSPQITVTQDTSSTRIAMMCFLGMYVAWTPGALGEIRRNLQAVARAAL